MRPLLHLAAALCALLFISPASANAIERLKAFNSGIRSLTAEFTQQMLDERMREVQANTGDVALERPGRFRWVYRTPYPQLLVSDGKTLWMYDPELKQATRRGIGGALSGSPAELLAGSADLERSYRLSNIGRQDGLEWLEAVPKRDDSGFVRIRIGMSKDNLPLAMELTDSFGQTTLLRFTDVRRNPRIKSEAFVFAPPAGVDVLDQ